MRSHEIRRRFLDHFTATRAPAAAERLAGAAGLGSERPHHDGRDAAARSGTSSARTSRRRHRLMTVQKCFRTVDIDEVGRTAHHLTFFEMLGNFSIGDYFKQFAVEQAWELVTSPRRLRVRPRQAVGDRLPRRRARCPADEEAIALWLGRRRARPSGSCASAATTSGRPARSGRAARARSSTTTAAPEFGCGRAECGPDCDCDRFIEFWNLVFMQYNMLDDGSLEPLPAAEHRHRRRARAGDHARPGRRQRVSHRRVR